MSRDPVSQDPVSRDPVSRATVLWDANVLYPGPLRDIFLQLAVMDRFQAKWTADIHRDWIEALMRKDPPPDRAALERTRDLVDRATRDSLIGRGVSTVPDRSPAP